LDTYATRRARLNSQLPFRIQQAHVFQMSFRPNLHKRSILVSRTPKDRKAWRNRKPGRNPRPLTSIISVYNERGDALSATLSACTQPCYPVSFIFVVDDGSQLPARLPDWAKGSSQIVLLRLEQNRGISAARNAAIARATSPLLACVNPEVLPDPDWVATCVDYLRARPQIGACYTRTVPDNTRGLLTRWRMRFQEPKFAEHTGPAAFAHGHAVFFRRAAVEAVGRLVQSGRELPGSSLSLSLSLSLPHQMDHHPCGKKCRQRPLLISANRYGSMGVRVVDRHRTHREAHFSRVITYRIRRG
jgi:cellulose synthase/poly-beta-1,6-N-acetylglucosamine synthase-like glycosyltransferase